MAKGLAPSVVVFSLLLPLLVPSMLLTVTRAEGIARGAAPPPQRVRFNGAPQEDGSAPLLAKEPATVPAMRQALSDLVLAGTDADTLAAGAAGVDENFELRLGGFVMPRAPREQQWSPAREVRIHVLARHARGPTQRVNFEFVAPNFCCYAAGMWTDAH